MTNHCSSLVDNYVEALRSDFEVTEKQDGCHLILPYYRPDGDAIELSLLTRSDGRVKLTDDYLTLDFLFLNGLNLDRNKDLYKDAQRLARRNGVTLDKSELFIESDPKELTVSLSSLLAAIDSITYLVYRRAHREPKRFADEVRVYLAQNEVAFSGEYMLPGKVVAHYVPIYINSDKNIVIEPLSTSSPTEAKHRAERLGFEVGDIHDVESTVQFVALVDDREEDRIQAWDEEDTQKILNTFMREIIPWAGRGRVLNIARSGL